LENLPKQFKFHCCFMFLSLRSWWCVFGETTFKIIQVRLLEDQK